MSNKNKKQTPPVTAEARFNKLTSLALDQIEVELLEKRATSQTLKAFLDLATQEARLKQEQIQLQNELLRAKIESEESANRVEEMVVDVMEALKSYTVDYSGEYYD
jgi:hypothetical protein